MVEAKTHCYGCRQKKMQQLGRNRGIPKTQWVLALTNIMKLVERGVCDGLIKQINAFALILFI